MYDILFERFRIYMEEYLQILDEIELLLPEGVIVEDILDFRSISKWETMKLVDIDFDKEYSKVLISNSEIALYVPVPTNIIIINTTEASRKYARAGAALELMVNAMDRNNDLRPLLLDKLKHEHEVFSEFKKSLKGDNGDNE